MHDSEPDHSSVDARGILPPRAYSIAVREAAGRIAVVELTGELDLATVPELRARLEELHETSAVVLDMERVDFVDSSALRELLRADAALGAAGSRLLLAAVAAPVERLLELTRTRDVLTLVPDVEQALQRAAE